MRFRGLGVALLVGLFLLTAVYAQRRFRGFGYDEEDVPIPPDASEKTEYAFARLRYPSFRGGFRGGGSWTTDYPKADRQFVQGVRRLTRIHTRSMEEVVDLDTDKIYTYPWIYITEVGRWELSDKQAAKLRDYLLRGGFAMIDDFHGGYEWDVFMASMSRVFPDRQVLDLQNADPIFHVLYDLEDRFQVPGVQYVYSGSLAERADGHEAHWRGIYDDKGRLMVAISHNMDLCDAWEWADYPAYPEKFASLAYRIGVNYIIYSMTH